VSAGADIGQTNSYERAIYYQWSRDVDGRVTRPKDPRHWFWIDRWTVIRLVSQ
jgi:hypothetical protein